MIARPRVETIGRCLSPESGNFCTLFYRLAWQRGLVRDKRFMWSKLVSSESDYPLQKRHENALNDMLEAVAFQGHASRPKWEIIRWFGQEKFSVNIRREIRGRWSDFLQELDWTPPAVLKIAEVNGFIFLLKGVDFFPDKE